MNGWRCPALRVPGAVVDAVYSEGIRIDSDWYKIVEKHNIIRWIQKDQPKEITLSITFTKDLSPSELTLKWKKLAILIPFITAITLFALGIVTQRAMDGGISSTPESMKQTKEELAQGVRNFFDSQDLAGGDPAIVMANAKDIVRRFDKEGDATWSNVKAEIERRKREDTNWTFATQLNSALALVQALGLSPETSNKNRAFLDMTLPAIMPKRM